MKRNRPSPDSSDKSPEQVWNTVVCVTNTVGTSEAKALRILLYIAIMIGNGTTLRERLRYRRKLWRLMCVAPRGKVSAAPKGRPLFGFFANTPAHMNTLLPVLRGAQKRCSHPSILTGSGLAVNLLGLDGTTNLVRLDELMAVTTLNERLAALYNGRKHFTALYTQFEKQAPHYAALVRCHRTGILTELILFMAVSHGLRRLYEAWDPSCVVSTSDLWPFEHAVFAVARERQIPSFVIQHGIVNRYWWPCVADKLLLWGEAFREELLQFGAAPDRLAVCGMPATDSLFVRYHGQSSSRPVKPASKYVVLSGTHTRSLQANLYLKYGALLKAVIAGTPALTWQVKLHPSEDDSFYRELGLFQFSNFSILPKNTSLEEAVIQADVACTLDSTAGLEAMIMKRPLVVFDVDPIIYEYAWWPKQGGGTYAPTAEAMLDFCRTVSIDGQFLADVVNKQDQFLLRNFANPARAAEVVLDTIEEVMKVSKSGVSEDSGHPRNPTAVN